MADHVVELSTGISLLTASTTIFSVFLIKSQPGGTPEAEGVPYALQVRYPAGSSLVTEDSEYFPVIKSVCQLNVELFGEFQRSDNGLSCAVDLFRDLGIVPAHCFEPQDGGVRRHDVSNELDV